MINSSSNYISSLHNDWQSIIHRDFDHSLDDQKVCTLAHQSLQIKELKEKYPQINVQIQERKIKPVKNGIYIGSLNSQGKPQGYGMIRYEDHSQVEAQFVDGKANGKGFKYFAPGWYYVGDFVDNNFDGRGQYISPGICYIGEFRNNTFHGQGELKLAENNGNFIGAMENGEMKKGVLRWQKKNPRDLNQILKFEYQGAFQNGKFHDPRAVLISNVGVYKGGFKDGMKHGPGKFQFNEKYQYIGSYENNMKKGYGTLYNPEITKIRDEEIPQLSEQLKNISYQGQFENNLPHGKGQIYRETEGKLVSAQYIEGIWSEAIIKNTNMQ